MDYELDDRECLKCGQSPTHSRRCLECHGEGGFDCYDDDPINYSPGEEFETCEVCHGSGIEWWCPECGTDLAEMQDAALLDLDQQRICCNPDCGWTGRAAQCVHPHHWPADRLCPQCNETTEALTRTIVNDDEQRQAIAAFVAEYGELREFGDEDKWMVWLGVWISAWHACVNAVQFDRRNPRTQRRRAHDVRDAPELAHLIEEDDR